MSTRPDEQGPAFRYRNESAIEAVAHELIALVQEFEASIREGHAPREFADRLARLRQTAELLGWSK